MKKKSQSSFEFISLFLLSSFAILTIIIMSYGLISDVSSKKEYFAIKEVAQKVSGEINIASKSIDGYKRNFEIPPKIEFIDYNISVEGPHLSVKSANSDYFLYIPNTIGNISKGNNTIRKENGVIYLNQ